MKLRNWVLALGMLIATGGWAYADSINGTLYYTTYTHVAGSNVWKVDFDYDGGLDPFTSFTLANNTGIASLGGADGIVFDPNGGNILIGGQSNTVYKITPGGVLLDAVAAGAFVETFHLSVDPTGDTVWVGTCCNGNGNAALGEVPLTPFASGVGHDVTGAVSFVDTLAWAPNASGGTTTWYTSSDPDGGECVGTINMTTFVTTNLSCDEPASHGMVFDPLSQTLIMMGDDHIAQWDPITQTRIADIDVGDYFCNLFDQCGDFHFDQGTVDGQGHGYFATNQGFLFFMDYSDALGYDLDDFGFIGVQFLNETLDDVAPLVGPGAPPVPEPMTLSLLGLGAAAFGRREWKRRASRA